MEYTDFEYDLRRKIVPVAPDPAFVEKLNERLRMQKKVFIEKSENSFLPLLSILGVFLGVGVILYLVVKTRKK
jgi:hypothetical protein